MADVNGFGPDGTIRCPNHHEILEGIPRPIPDKGEGRCPVSKCMFSFEVNPEKVKYVRTASGDIIKKPWADLTGEETK